MNILLTHTAHAFAHYYGDEALAALRRLAVVRRNPSNRALDASGLLEQADGCEVIISDRQTPVEAVVFDKLPELVAVLRCAVDIRNIDRAAADRNDALITHASAGYADAVAELAVGFMVDLSRGVSDAVFSYRTNEIPAVRTGVQLSGSSVGIIGYGVIGKRLSELCQALGMKVLVADPYRAVETPGVQQTNLTDLLGRARFVVCLAPAVQETKGLMNDKTFEAMRPGGFFINLSRGGLVDEAALERALDSGHLTAAALDVGSAPDQMPSERLTKRADVIATPHIGGLTPAAVSHQAFDTVRQVAALLEGQIPAGAVNALRATRLVRLGIQADALRAATN